jgi:type II secretory pathway component PulF
LAKVHTASIDSTADAGRYLGELGGQLGLSAAIRRVQDRSTGAIVEQLAALDRFASGQSELPPAAEFSLIGEVARNMPADADAGPAFRSAASAQADARSLAEQVRVGLPGDLFYVVTLLVVAFFVALIFFTSIAPDFSLLFTQFDTPLPALSRIVIDAPWLIFGSIVVIGVGMFGLVVCTVRLSRLIAAIAPLSAGLAGRLAGARLHRSHRRWRLLTLASALAAGGQPPAEALARAAAASGVAESEVADLADQVALAADLGVAGSELAHLQEQQASTYRRDLEIWRAVMLRVLQVVIAVFVGVLVIAMYLPIVKVGAVT